MATDGELVTSVGKLVATRGIKKCHELSTVKLGATYVITKITGDNSWH